MATPTAASSPLSSPPEVAPSPAPPSTPPAPVRSSVKRKRTTTSAPVEVVDPTYRAATAKEKAEWGGFCEIESDPAIFNNLLSGLGVRDVKITEVPHLELLEFVPKPIYGFIFLFQYAADADHGSQVETAPPHVWFANQVVPNCCATVALINMVNNLPTIELGPQMSKFREFSAPFSAGFKGELVANAPFIRQNHNKYARKMDMLVSDTALEEEFTAATHKRRKTNKQRKSASKAAGGLDKDSAFHYSCMMLIENEIWRLDGLDAAPQRLAEVAPGTDWLDEVKSILQARMMVFEEANLQFSLLALVKDPVATKKQELVNNIHLINTIERKLDGMQSDWRTFTESTPETIHGENEELAITAEDLIASPISDQERARVDKFDDVTSLLELLTKATTAQGPIRGEARRVIQEAQEDEEKALDHQNDYVPFIQTWLEMLAENGDLKDLIEED